MYSTCVEYEGELPENSKLKGKCPSVEDTTEELYEKVSEIEKTIDIKDIEENCIVHEGITVVEYIEKMATEICNLKSKVEEQETFLNTEITEEIDLKCFEGVVTLKDLLQKIINNNCSSDDNCSTENNW
ncbi:MAG TPA: hypothetical protein VK031_00135 [Tissierellaceae bacterium]|nr:hypothetical protein [Tissierellaceae bacterium]